MSNDNSPVQAPMVMSKKFPDLKPEDVTFDDLKSLSKDSFPMWALTSGAKVDGNEVDFNHHRYLLPLYMDTHQEIVWQKAAQLGATVYLLLRVLWWLKHHQGRKAGLYFPTKEGVDNLSSDRLTPLINSCPDISSIARSGDKLGLRKIGDSSFYLYHLGGVASKDSVPLDFITFDEVRLCSAKDIDQALERVSHSPYKVRVYMSTAGLPNASIASRFEEGTQHVWRSACGCGPDGVDLARTFPDCVVPDDPRHPDPYLRCPKCKYIIRDPQNGRYVPMNPGADYHSYHVSQLVSKFISLKEIWRFYQRTTNMEEFYNAKLGLPFVDAKNQGVSLAEMKESIRPDLEWGEPGKKNHPKGTAMGIDQGGGYVYITIADYDEDGFHKRIRHLEIIERNNPDYYVEGREISPFHRAAQLMHEYNVQLCVCDHAPNYDDALDFAQEFPRKVFLAWYSQEAKDAVAWGDRIKTKRSLMKAGQKLRFKYTVYLSRYLSMNIALSDFRKGNVIMPVPEKRVQMCRDEKTSLLKPEAAGERFINMLPRLIKRFRCTNEDTGEGKHQWIYAGGDPHFAHSWNYCNVALERLNTKTKMLFA